MNLFQKFWGSFEVVFRDFLGFSEVVFGGMFFSKSALAKVTPRVSKTGGGEGGQGHFWTMSKSKRLFFRMSSLIAPATPVRWKCPWFVSWLEEHGINSSWFISLTTLYLVPDITSSISET